mmetsp:Transcript_6606/g.21693  ORF Transcript_6606/g.21693 Transcript_6606/m.21693 type:complete len:396 (-) Transcript_6606:39-1226(-)
MLHPPAHRFVDLLRAWRGHFRVRGLEGSREGGTEDCEVGVVAARYADAPIQRRRPRHAHKDVALEELGENEPRKGAVPAAVDGDEVGCAGQGCQPVLVCDAPQSGSGVGNPPSQRVEVRLVLERGERPRLAHPADAKVVAHLVKGGDDLGCAERVPDPAARESVPLGEGAQAQHTQVVDRDVRVRVEIDAELVVRLVHEQQAAGREALDELLDALGRVPRATGVVRIDDVEHLRIHLPRLGQQRVQVLPVVVAVGHSVQVASAPGYEIVQSRVCPAGRDQSVARRNQEVGRVRQEPVHSLTNHNVERVDSVLVGKGRAQLVRFGVAIHPRRARCLRHGLYGLLGGPERELVCAQSHRKAPAARALNLLGRDKGHNRRQGLHDWRESGAGDDTTAS